MSEKSKIYYTRTYRHLKKNSLEFVLYLLLFILPCLLVFCFFLPEITGFVTNLAQGVLSNVFPEMAIGVNSDDFSLIGTIYYLDMPTVKPGIEFVFGNLIVVFVLMLIMGTGKRKGKPLAIFGLLACFVHLVNCVFFIFAGEHFPYEATTFSDLYIKQQVGIWITFIVLSGLVTGYLGTKRYYYKILTFVSIMLYSFVFGTLRYIVFLFLLQEYSILYMALMYFVVGPAFDFLYFVGIYSVFANKMVEEYSTGSGKEEWEWL